MSRLPALISCLLLAPSSADRLSNSSPGYWAPFSLMRLCASPASPQAVLALSVQFVRVWVSLGICVWSVLIAHIWPFFSCKILRAVYVFPVGSDFFFDIQVLWKPKITYDIVSSAESQLLDQQDTGATTTVIKTGTTHLVKVSAKAPAVRHTPW